MRNLHRAGIIAVSLLCAAGASAQTTTTSGARAASVSISAAGTAKAAASVGGVAGSGQGYDVKGGAAAGTQSWLLVDGLATDAYDTLALGASTTEALGTGGATPTATGSVTILNASNELRTVTALVPLIGLKVGATTLGSTTTVGQAADGSFYGSGAATLAGFGLSGSLLSGLVLDVAALASAGPNTVALLLPGLKLTLNEQLSQSFANGLSFQTNAVHLAFNDYSYGGSLLSGDVVLGHSEASISAVPEPAGWATMLAGFLGVGVMLRRRRQAASRAATVVRASRWAAATWSPDISAATSARHVRASAQPASTATFSQRCA